MSTNVEIEYCVPCGHLNRAVDTQQAILEHFGREIDGVRLKTGHGGVFTIRVDGEQITTPGLAIHPRPWYRRHRLATVDLDLGSHHVLTS